MSPTSATFICYVIKRNPKIFSINVEVNSHLIKAFVDSGAQSTISKFLSFPFPYFLELTFSRFITQVSPEAAQACGLVFFSIYQLYLKSYYSQCYRIFFFQSNASFGYEICRNCSRCRNCKHPRKSTQCATQACRLAPTLFIHHHGGTCYDLILKF